MAGLHFDITGDNSNFLRKLEESRQGVQSTSKQIEESGMSIEQMFARMTTAVAAFGIGLGAKQLVSDITRVRGEFQQLEVAFKTMLGSKEQADTLMSQLVRTAAITPFDLQGVANGAKQLLAYGTAAEDVNGTLVRLGDIAAGLSIPLNDLVWLYGTTMTQGRLFTQDLRQFQGRGIPLADELAKQFGVTKDKVGELVTAGKVGFPEVQKAIEAMTNEGSKFGGLMESQSKTITGQISNIEDAISTMFNEIGKENESIINGVLSGTSYLVEHWKDVATAIESAAVAYGTYKAAIMATAALQGAEQTLKVDTEIEGLKSLLVVKEESKNADIAAAVASGRLTESKAAELTMLREELTLKISTLEAQNALAEKEYANALLNFNAAEKRLQSAQDAVDGIDDWIASAEDLGNTELANTYRTQLAEKSTELQSAAIARNSAQKALNDAATKKKSTSEALNTVTTQANTVANHANTASMNIMKLAAIQLSTILKGLWATLMANPLFLVIGAFAGLAFAVYKVATAESEAETATRMYNEALDEQRKKQDEYKERIDALVKTIDDNNKSEGERLQAFEALKAEYPTILNNLLTEAEYLKDIAKYKKLIAEEDNNRARQSDAEILEQEKRKFEYYQRVRKNGTSTTLVDMDGNGWATDNVEDAIKAQQVIVNKAIAKVASHDVTSYLGNIKDMKDEDIVSVIDEIAISLKALAENGDDAIAIVTELGGEFSKSQLLSIKNALETEQKSRSGEKNTGKGWIEKYKNNYLEAQKELEDFLNTESCLSETEYEKKLKDLTNKKDEAEKKYKSVGGITNNKKDSESEKLRQQQEKYNLLLDKQALEQKRSAEDLQMQVDEARIKAMKEGSAKTIAEMELNFEKEMQTIDRQKEDALRKKIEDARTAWEANPENKGKSFDTTSIELSDDERQYYDELYKIAIANNEKIYNDLADKYQSYTDQRITIEKKFNDDIAVLQEARKKAEAKGDIDEVSKIDRSIAKATADKGKELMSHDFDVLKQSPEYIRAFEDLKNTSSETLGSLLEQLENAKATAATILNPEDLREYTTTIQEIMDELDSRNPFQALADRQKELAEAEKELTEAKKQLDAVNRGAKIVTGVKSTSLGDDGKIKIENTYLTATEALAKYNAAKDKSQRANNNFIKAEKTAREKVDELADAIKGIGDAIGGQAGEIISLMGDVALFATGTIDGISKVAQTGANAISAVEKASVILGIISTAIQLLQKIGEMGSNKAFNQYEAYAEKLKEINALTDAVNQYRIAALEAQQAESNWFSTDNLKNLRDYKALHDEVAKAYADKAMESQAVYQNQSGGGWLTGAFNWVMGNLSALSWWDKWKNIWGQGDYDKGQTAAINNLRIETRKKSKGFLGTGIGGKSQKTEDLATWAKNQGLGDLFDDEGLINKELAQSLIDNYGNKLVGQTKETLEALISLREQYDEYIEQLHEYVSSLYEPLVDNFVDSLWDWLDNGKDALKSFNDYASDTFRDIVSDMMRTIVLDKVVGSFSDDIAALYEEYAKGAINEAELMRKVAERTGGLIDNYEQNIPTLQNIMEQVNSYLQSSGIDLKQSESTSQSTTSRGFGTEMTHEDAGELSGRFTALQITGEEIKNAMISMLAIADIISVSISNNSITLIEIKNVMIMSNGYLEDIAIYTKKILNKFSIKLDSINKNIEKAI